MAGHERPEVVRVVGASHAKRALVALLVIVALIGMAAWKPWASAPEARPAPADVAAQVAVTPDPAEAP